MKEEPEPDLEIDDLDLHLIDTPESSFYSMDRLEFDDMDKFFRLLYIYYLDKGFYSSMLKKIIVVIQYIVLTSLIYILIWSIDYPRTLQDKKLHMIPYYLTFCSFCYLAISIISGIIYIIHIFMYTIDLLSVKKFCTDTLDLTDSNIQTIKWDDFVSKIEIAQNKYKFYKLHPTLSEQQIIHHIMRQENIFIALVQKKLIPCELNIYTKYFSYKLPYLSKLYEYCVHYCIIEPIFDNRKQFSLYNLNRVMEHRIKIAAYGILVFSPFILVILFMYFLFRYFEDFRQNSVRFRTRKWSRYAMWVCRHPCEVYHKLHKRMSIAYIYANLYVNNFDNEFTNIIARYITFMTSVFITIPFLLSFFSEDILYIHFIGDKTILWIMGICGLIFSISRRYIKDDYQLFIPEKYMKHVISYTQYNPAEWTDIYHTQFVLSEFCKLFQHRFVYIFEEIASVFIVPYILITKLPYDLEFIIDFYKIQIKKDTKFNLGYIYQGNFLKYIDLEESIDENFLQNIMTFSIKDEFC